MMQKVDETIDVLCEWIQGALKDVNAVQEQSILPDIVKALAELVSARGNETIDFLLPQDNPQ